MLAVSKSVSNILTQCHNVKEFIIPADNISKRSRKKKKKKSWPNNDNNNTGIFISETEQLFTMTIPSIYIYMIYMLFNGKHLLSIIQ